VPVLLYTLAGRVTESCTAQLYHLKEANGERTLDLRRKGGKGRVWPLPERLCDLIDVATADRTTGSLLLDDDDKPMDRHGIDRLLTRLGKQAGVLSGRDLTPHVLRASKLTHMHDARTPVEEIQEYADHAAIETTLRYIRRRDSSARRRLHAAAAVAVYDRLVDRFTASP
jgi:integrase